MLKPSLLTTGAALVAALSITTPVAAATTAPQGLVMSPPLQNITLSSGLVEAHNSITLSNHTAQPVSVTLKPVDLSSLGLASGFGFDQAASASLSKYGLANWMTLPAGNKATIAAGATTNVPVYVQNRSDLKPGGHYGAVVISSSDSPAAAGRVGFSQELVSLLFVTKLGGEQYGIKVDSMKASGGLRPTSAQLTFTGIGNVHTVPRGLVQLTDARGKILSKGIINTESALVLPGATRVVSVPLHSVATSRVPGNYKLTAYYRPDEVNHFTTYSIMLRSWTAWLQLAAIVIVVLIGIGLGLFMRRNRRTATTTAH